MFGRRTGEQPCGCSFGPAPCCLQLLGRWEERPGSEHEAQKKILNIALAQKDGSPGENLEFLVVFLKILEGDPLVTC